MVNKKNEKIFEEALKMAEKYADRKGNTSSSANLSHCSAFTPQKGGVKRAIIFGEVDLEVLEIILNQIINELMWEIFDKYLENKIKNSIPWDIRYVVYKRKGKDPIKVPKEIIEEITSEDVISCIKSKVKGFVMKHYKTPFTEKSFKDAIPIRHIANILFQNVKHNKHKNKKVKVFGIIVGYDKDESILTINLKTNKGIIEYSHSIKIDKLEPQINIYTRIDKVKVFTEEGGSITTTWYRAKEKILYECGEVELKTEYHSCEGRDRGATYYSKCEEEIATKGRGAIITYYYENDGIRERFEEGLRIYFAVDIDKLIDKFDKLTSNTF